MIRPGRLLCGVLALGLWAAVSPLGPGIHAAAARAVGGSAGTAAYRFTRSAGPVRPLPVRWQPCFDGLDCAIVAVPLDHADARSTLIDLSVVRRPAGDPATRLGVLFINPGGPGAPTADLVRDADQVLPAAVLARFDVVGVDPRGTENSTPVRCGSASATVTSSADAVRQLARRCGRLSGELLPHIDSLSSMEDLDWVRRAMGERQVTYLGFSYGGYLGALYADRHPASLRAVVLDSGLDGTPFGSGLLVDKARSWDRTLRAFLQACADGTLVPCAFRGAAPASSVTTEDLVNRYRTVIARYPDPRTLRHPEAGPDALFDSQVLTLLEDRQRGWPELASGLARSTSGADPSTVLDTTVLDRPVDATSIVEAFLAYVCRDGQYPRDAASLAALPGRLRQAAPLFPAADLAIADVSVCRSWPVPALRLPPITRVAGPPVLVIGSTLDTAAPYEWQQSLAASTGGTLLTRVGPGHGAITLSRCVADAAAAFLTDLTTPLPGLVCRD